MVDEVAVLICFGGFDECEITEESGFHNVVSGFAAVGCVEGAEFFAFGDDGTDSGSGEECWDSSSPSSYAFGERALGVELDFELVAEVLACELVVLTNLGGDHFFDLFGGEEEPEPPVIDAGIIGDAGDVFDP